MNFPRNRNETALLFIRPTVDDLGNFSARRQEQTKKTVSDKLKKAVDTRCKKKENLVASVLPKKTFLYFIFFPRDKYIFGKASHDPLSNSRKPIFASRRYFCGIAAVKLPVRVVFAPFFPVFASSADRGL